MTRHIAVITTSRADWSHLRWPLRELAGRAGVRISLIATAAHMSHEFGQTVEEIRREGYEVHAAIESLISSDTDVGMAKTIGVAALSLADTLGSKEALCRWAKTMHAFRLGKAREGRHLSKAAHR